MRKRAIAAGSKLSEYGLIADDGTPAPCRDEAEIYEALGLSYVPPEMREDTGEFALAEAGMMPNLIDSKDLRGTFHCHTDYSDGANTLEQMAEAAMAKGWEYLGIADHSRSAAYAGGMSVEKVRKQWDEIDRLNGKFGGKFRLLKGIECDILADGSMDYPDEILSEFDFVVASIHSGFGQDRAAQTARLIRAAENPHVTMLGHPTGRLLLARPGYDVDLEAVIQACARTGTMIEINASPYRLDLDTEGSKFAKRCGVMISINPDAHSIAGLDDVEYGIGVARRAGLEPKDVLNVLGLRDILERLAR
jgi:DNA polymerase (family 10)